MNVYKPYFVKSLTYERRSKPDTLSSYFQNDSFVQMRIGLAVSELYPSLILAFGQNSASGS